MFKKLTIYGGHFIPNLWEKMYNNKPNFSYDCKSVFKIDSVLHVSKGPEFCMLKKDSLDMLFNKKFTIGVNNRMGYNFNEKLQVGLKSIISSPVLPGTIQLTPSGNIIVLHRDCQTTGGYPRILQLNEKSLDDLSQFKNGDKIKLKLIGNMWSSYINIYDENKQIAGEHLVKELSKQMSMEDLFKKIKLSF